MSSGGGGGTLPIKSARGPIYHNLGQFKQFRQFFRQQHWLNTEAPVLHTIQPTYTAYINIFLVCPKLFMQRVQNKCLKVFSVSHEQGCMSQSYSMYCIYNKIIVSLTNSLHMCPLYNKVFLKSLTQIDYQAQQVATEK